MDYLVDKCGTDMACIIGIRKTISRIKYAGEKNAEGKTRVLPTLPPLLLVFPKTHSSHHLAITETSYSIKLTYLSNMWREEENLKIEKKPEPELLPFLTGPSLLLGRSQRPGIRSTISAFHSVIKGAEDSAQRKFRPTTLQRRNQFFRICYRLQKPFHLNRSLRCFEEALPQQIGK
jgi:hypothetical protein